MVALHNSSWHWLPPSYQPKFAYLIYIPVYNRTIYRNTSKLWHMFDSHRFGRKIVLLGGCAAQLVMALIAAFMPTFASFSVFRFLTSVAVTHAYLTAFVLSKLILVFVCFYKDINFKLLVKMQSFWNFHLSKTPEIYPYRWTLKWDMVTYMYKDHIDMVELSIN